MNTWNRQAEHLDQFETVRDLQQRMEKAKKERGQLLLDLGQQQYRTMVRNGQLIEVEGIMETDALIYEASRRIKELQDAMKPHRCISCDASLEKDAKFCGSCGTAVPQPDIRPKIDCKTCGAPQPTESAFCTCCGGQMEAKL